MRAFMNWIKAAANHARDWWNSVTNRPDNSPSDNQGAISKQSDNQDTNVQQNTNGPQATNSKNTNNKQSTMLNHWSDFWTNFWNVLDRLADGLFRAAMIGVILYVVATSLCPELSEKFPVIYGWYTGCTQFVEFAMKTALRGLYSLFSGQWSEFVPEFGTGWDNLLQQFTNWIAGLQ